MFPSSRDSTAHGAQSGAPPPPLRQPSSHTVSEHNISSRSIRISRPGGPGAHLHLSIHSTTACAIADTRRAHPNVCIFLFFLLHRHGLFPPSLHFYSPRWFYVLIESCEEKKKTDSGRGALIVTAQLHPHRAANLVSFALIFETYWC